MNWPDGFRFSIDRGGTFTDIYAEVPVEPGFRTLKLLSVNPDHYPDAALEGIRRILEEVSGISLPPGPLETDSIHWVRMGTTLATNALLERKGATVGLVTTRGFRDLLAIGKQDRPLLFDLEIKKPELLFQEVIEINERVRRWSPADDQAGPKFKEWALGEDRFVIEASPQLDEVQESLQGFLDQGIRSLAIVLMHGYLFPDHEQAVATLARQMGFDHVSLSSEVMPRIKMVDRGHTTLVDAYLTPVIRNYVQNFRKGLKTSDLPLWFMKSDGGLVEADRFLGSGSILSGPAGGVAGYAHTAWNSEDRIPVIGFDMGGTSTDVSRFEGNFDWVHETELAGVHLQAPQLNIHTVAAGGGSRLDYKNGMFLVGPESAGAFPGPACYGRGGPLALTDANLLLGRIQPDHFPQVFGDNESQPLNSEASRQALSNLLLTINQDLEQRGRRTLTLEEAASGFVEVANEQMARAIRQVTFARGYDARDHKLACFGGAGAQHACALARILGIRRVHIHRFAGILSAYGLGLADVIEEEQEPASFELTPSALSRVEDRFALLEERARGRLQQSGFERDQIESVSFLHLRYEGTDHPLAISRPQGGDFLKAFYREWQRLYGFKAGDRKVLVDVIRVRSAGKTVPVALPPMESSDRKPEPASQAACFLEGGWRTVPVFEHEKLPAGFHLAGPALIVQNGSMIVLESACTATVNSTGDIEIEISGAPEVAQDTELDPIRLAIFGNRFMAIAEEMGRVLEHTAVSTNIKERRDFSCALFSAEGDLVANAPHQPVHLGSMGEAVKAQIRIHGEKISPGDSWMSNHPVAGGTHLPDVTVINPVFEEDRLLFFVASRGHHADIGGISPGSMPPFATRLCEEGAAVESFQLVDGGTFLEDRVRARLSESPGSDTEGKPIPGARAIQDNLSDLKAQVAANQRGLDLLHQLVQACSVPVVEAYMRFIRQAAAGAVSQKLREMWESGFRERQVEDQLDDGTPICLDVTLTAEGRATFDFSGSGPQVEGNLNAPPAVTLSAVLYCLRCLAAGDMPLNQGCLEPVTVVLPKGSLLNPSKDAAVAAGNVLTSQRVVDVVLRTFECAAASQGCMNNVLFGDETFAYYETIGGGSGAGPAWHGASGVHTHMTNTRITDPEILEQRYPVILREFSIRNHSGGRGKFNGGNGLVRELEFCGRLDVAILSERRITTPYGMKGGLAGSPGENWLIRSDGSRVRLQGKCALTVSRGDRIRILTPCGGGYGKP